MVAVDPDEMSNGTQSTLEAPGPGDQPVPVVLATAVVDNEQAIRQLLDSQVEKLLTGEVAAVRAALREFARHNRSVFAATCLSVGGHEQFFQDVRAADTDPGTVEKLEALHEAYSILTDEFATVSTEFNYSLHNPYPSVSTTPEFDQGSGLPLMKYYLTSGNVDLGEFRVPPSQAVALVNTLVKHAQQVLQQSIDRHGEVSPAEVDRLWDRLDDIGSNVAETETHVDAIDDALLAERDEANQLERENANYYFN
jgi:hypothetical protein